MSAPSIETAAVVGTAPATAPPPRQGARRLGGSVRHYLVMPAALAVASLLLYLWVRSHQLDSIETRLLNGSVVRQAILRHLELVAVSTIIVVLTAIPLGVLVTRPFARALVPIVVGLGNMGQTIPSLGVIVLLALVFGIGFKYTVIALAVYAFLPVLRNTMVGLRQVDPSVIEAGRGMGMTKKAVLRQIELPLAVPIVLAGIRTAVVINVGTAAIAVFTNAGGLGLIIYGGIVQARNVVLIAGSVMTAILALTVDYLAGLAEELLSPRGL